MSSYLEAKASLSLPLSSSSSLPPGPLPLSKVSFISDTRIIASVGNALHVSKVLPGSSSGLRNDWVFSETGRGFSAFAYSLKSKRLAYSPRRLNPDIEVVVFPEQSDDASNVVCRLER